MGFYRLKHKFIEDDVPKETEEFYTFQKNAKEDADKMALTKLRWTKLLRFQSAFASDYVFVSSPKEGETFLIETIHFKR